MEKRANISERLRSQEDIDKYLHPKKRSRISILIDMHKPVFKDKANLLRYILDGICGGLLPVLSAYAIYWLLSVIEAIGIEGSHSFGDARPVIITAAVFCLVYLTLDVLSTQIAMRQETQIMSYRLEIFEKIFYKLSTMDMALAMDARLQNSLGPFFEAIEGNNVGYEGVLTEVFHMARPLFAFIVFSIILSQISIWIPVIGIVGIIITAIGEYKYSLYYERKVPEKSKIVRTAGKVNALAQDFTYGKDIRIFSMQDLFNSINDKLLEAYDKYLRGLRRVNALYTIPKALAFALIDIGIIYVVIRSFYSQGIEISTFIMILSISSIFVSQIMQLSGSLSFIYHQIVSVSYLFDFLEADLKSEGGEDLDLFDFDNFDIVFDDVYFKYPGSDDYVLEGVSFTIDQGQSLALVGLNGAGKTTITNLLTGLYMPTKGHIYIGGIDINYLSQASLNKIIGPVFQDFEPLAIKVKENVSARDEASRCIDEERVIDALKKADIYEKISSFDKGINSMMLRVIEDDGMVLSGGENQKISIARALYKENTGLLIFDEPTSALDALAEELLYRDFADLSQGKSALFISHRLASTRFCDQIALLNGGEIQEIGTHEDLLAMGGLYKEMYDTQASYYKEDGENE